MKKLLYIFILLPVMAVSQTTTQNFVKTLVYKDATATSDFTKANATVTYYDGLGRPIQQIAGKQSDSGKDIITHIEYDGFGRQAKEYMPYAATTDNEAFAASAQASTVIFYNTSAFENTSNPYSEKFFEASPLNRVLKQGAPGTAWLGNPIAGDANDYNDHTVKFAYLTNSSSDAVKNLTATAGAPNSYGVYDITFVSSGSTYAAGKLYKTITQDENKASAISSSSKLNTIEEYKNMLGQVLLKRTFKQDDGQPVVPLDTYYVYDQYGNLTYVLPPLANGSISQADKLCYQYKYDSRNRLIEKKLPGKTWEFMVYDKQDHIVATGPVINPWGGLETNTGWIITRYDAFGRVAYTGWYAETGITSAQRNTLQTTYAFSAVTRTTTPTIINSVPVNYTNASPSIQVLSTNYYDTYGFVNAPTLPSSIEGQTVSTNVKGLATGTWVRALTAIGETLGETTLIAYDTKGRTIRTRTLNYLGGYTMVDSKLDFDGQVVYTKASHKRSSNTNDLVVNTQDDFTYTAQDRLLSQTHTITGQSAQLMTYNTYNSIGQLTRKKVGSTSSAPLQQVDYTYNIRGWLKGINAPAPNAIPTGPSDDLFRFTINYNNAIAQSIGGKVVPLYNGNIAETTWQTGSDNIQRRYGYTYDKLNRLTDAWYQMPDASVAVRSSYDEHLTYDNNGNIMSLQRNGEQDSATLVEEIDDLTYFYDGNRLNKVTDASNNTAGFKDVEQNGVNDYTYDGYGNMLTDKNKGITTNITYNHLNLPVTIIINNGAQGPNGTITYLYSAAGVKLKKTVTPSSGTTVVTDYLGGYQYVNNVLEFFPTSEGYVKHTISENVSYYSYVFQHKDHLGNVRISYMKGLDNVLKILEEDHYYPFGLKHEGYSATQQMVTCSRCPGGSSGASWPVIIVPVINPGDATYKYNYNSKELQDEMGLDWYDYQARNYDPALGRWMNIDPLAEISRRWSPYNYCMNNPVFFIDPDGMQVDPSSQKSWDKQKQSISDRRDDLQKKVDKLNTKAQEKGWSASKLANKVGDLNDRIKSLDGSLATLGTLESSVQVYSLNQIGSGQVGGLSYDSSTGNVVINFDGSTSNFVHETTHGGQFENGDVAFDSATGKAYAVDVGDEVAAYKAQYAFEPSSVGVTSSASITTSWLHNVTDPAGNKIYAPGGSANTGLIPLNTNSTKADMIKAYPHNKNLQSLPNNFTFKSISTLIFRK